MTSTSLSLYAQVMGEQFNALPAVVRALHNFAVTGQMHGRASVTRGSGLAARLAAKIGGFPETVAETPVSVTFDVSPRGETWTRDFGGHKFRSHLASRQRRGRTILTEQFGLLMFDCDLTGDAQGLEMRLVSWRCRVFGHALPLPQRLLPRINARESEIEGRFRFDVHIAFPWGGLIVHYQGWLAPVPSAP